MKRLTALLLAALFLVMPLAGCTSDKEEDAKTKIEEEDKGAIIQTFLTSTPSSIDPSAIYGSSETIKLMGLLYEGLTTIDENGKMQKALAKEWEYEIDERDDYMKLEIKLNSSRWSDGIIVDADDFIFAWTRLLKPENKNENAALLYPILNAKKAKEGLVSINDVGLTAVKDNVIEIIFEKEYSEDDFVEYFLRRLASPALVPLREDVVTSREGWDLSGKSSYVTNGPFKIKIWDDYQLALERSVYYRCVGDNDRNADDKIVKPYQIINSFREGKDSNDQFERYRDETEMTKKVFYVSLAGASIPVYEAAEDMKKSKVVTDSQLSTYCLFFNTNNELLSDARVRKALSLAIDREALCALVAGEAKPATGLIPYGIEDVKAKQDFRKKGGDIVLKNADIEAAKALLKEAGVKGGNLKVEASNARGYEKTVLNAVASAWKELGFKLEVTTKRGDFIYNKANGLLEFTQNEVDILAFDLQSMTSNAYGMLMQFSAEFGGHPIDVTTGPSEEDVVFTPYFTGFSDEEYDKICAEAVAAVTDKERTAALHKAEEYIMDKAPVAPLFFNSDTYLVSNVLSGIETDKFGRLNLIELKQKGYEKYKPKDEE